MKKLVYCAMGLALVFASSCKKEMNTADNGKTLFGTEKPLIVVPGSILDTLVGDITVNTTVNANAFLKGIVFVKPGVTLTINAGITIFGSDGPVGINPADLSLNKGTLVVERGGRLIANGTATSPIVWTSIKPAGQRSFGDWGGVVILGSAPVAASVGGVCQGTNTFEALNDPAFGTRTQYGGTAAADNSGSLRYNRIEFAGGPIAGADREVNGLTLCGVGNGTTLDFIQVANSGDDGFEFFGGTVNAKHLFAYANKDDDFDFDEGYKGKLQFIFGYRTTLADNSASHFIENDGNPAAIQCGASFNRTQPFILNATLLAEVPGAVTGGGRFDTSSVLVRRGASMVFANSIVKVLPVRRFTRTFALTNAPVAGASTSFNLLAQGSGGFPSDSIYIGVNRIDQGSAPFLAVSSTNQNGTAGLASISLPLQGNASTPIPATFLGDFPGGFNLSGLGFFTTTSRVGAFPTDAGGTAWLLTGSWFTTATN